ncbi:MAG: orotidine-5'-phosphate decarboxylase [Dehalococcoidia bacterium]|nr:orotidine-5'-phosphate decarboxylase [Dehalococcoidia bacterium]
MTTFLEKLLAASASRRSLLCVGLDPDPAQMPVRDVAQFNRAIIEATSDLVCAYKPNLGFYEGLGEEGMDALRRTLDFIPRDIPVIGDAKRGDISPTANFYAKAMFEVWGFDAVTVNPYLGRDALEPFLAYEDRGVFVLCRTSNPGARDLQDLLVTSPYERTTMPLYEAVAMRAAAWNLHHNIGLVVGATYPDELRRVRELCPDMPILVPGVGTQGGSLEQAIRNGVDANGQRVIVTASRGVLYASRDPNAFASAAREQAIKLRDRMNLELQQRGIA